MPSNRAKPTAAARALAMRKSLTPPELALWQRLRRNQLGVRFRRQEPIGPDIADFVCVDRRLVVEADGVHHDLSETDEARDAYLRQLGYRVLRFQNKDIAWHPEWVIDKIRKGLGAPPPPAPPAVPSTQGGTDSEIACLAKPHPPEGN